MAYSKTTWVDNTTPIDKDNLNKIEQGIYDNSLVVDAVTNTLNPTDTETYKTAELTEGQITDVIGVNDIVIKGNTEQDGTPTPSSPVDVNVVSGSNVVNTSNKNLLDKDGEISQGSTNSATGTDRISIRVKQKLKANTTYTVITNLNTSIFQWAFVLGTKVSPWDFNQQLYDSQWKTTSNFSYTTSQECYINIPIRKPSNADINVNDVKDYWFMLYEGNYDSSVSYEPHQGKELPLDLPVENLFDKDNVNKIDCLINNGTKTISNYSGCKTLYIPIKGEKTYTVSKKVSARFVVGSCSSLPANNVVCSNTIQDNNAKSLTLTTNANDTYLAVFYYLSGTDTLTEQEILNSIQIEQGSKANAYTTYGTDPIELCKIGNYQDYFYKSGSKWYLHKEIGKVVLDGSENWVKSSNSNVNRYYISGAFISLPLNANSVDLICNYFKCITQNQSDALNLGLSKLNDTSIMINFALSDTNFDTLAKLKEWLSNSLVKVNYVLKTPTDTEIIDTTLISQLEAIYNAPLYEQTNITQTNNDLPMILDITACKDNINGIKAFIRK